MSASRYAPTSRAIFTHAFEIIITRGYAGFAPIVIIFGLCSARPIVAICSSINPLGFSLFTAVMDNLKKFAREISPWLPVRQNVRRCDKSIVSNLGRRGFEHGKNKRPCSRRSRSGGWTFACSAAEQFFSPRSIASCSMTSNVFGSRPYTSVFFFG